MRAPRGAALSACRIDAEAGRGLFAGIGNVEGRGLVGGRSAGLAPRNGTLGMNQRPPKIAVQEIGWEPGATLILHSDGVRARFDLGEYRDLRRHDPVLLAAAIHRDCQRGRDDATVLVLRDARGGTA